MIALQVAYAVSTPLSGSKLKYQLFNDFGNSKLVSGNRAVEQNVVMVLLTDPGTDPFNRELGGGLRRAVIQPVDSTNIQTRKADIASTIIRTEKQIVASQFGISFPPSERLRNIEILKIEFDGVSTWTVDLYLHMEDGNAARVLLGT